MSFICSCLLIVFGAACGSKNENKVVTRGPLDGTWKLTDLQCEGVSVLSLAPDLAGQSWDIKNTSGTWKLPDSLGTATLTIEITYPSTGKLGYQITNGPNFSSVDEHRNYLADMDKQNLFLALTDDSIQRSFNYSVDENTLRFTNESDVDGCEIFGYSGPITNVAVRE